MDPRMLAAFIAVAEEGNFTRAAERLHLVQSSVSASVKALERTTGLRLLYRGTRAVTLTAEGRSFLPFARAAMEAMEAAQDSAAAIAGGIGGHVAVGVLATPDIVSIASSIATLHQRHPDLRISVKSALGGSLALQDDVLANVLDVCFVVLPFPQSPELTVEPLLTGKFVLACGTSHPWAGRSSAVTPDELSGADLVEFPRGFTLRDSTDRELAARGVTRRTSVEVPHLDLISSYVAAGVGVGFVTEWVARDHPGLVALHTPWIDMHWTVAAAWANTRRLSLATETFLETVRENCRRAIENDEMLFAPDAR
ncbi:MAG: LysR family transcriptional regulator [Microbacterium sp.]|uniref:LysR family transcriptional regulator n=1 Tax=Microbacterium sp. TaxID=51671 RepID=UPI002725D270|nr:LysR family transcriptional regulator [Microbacterium sp.]MDO8382774.1 LysR family transcriptional regulator [Microbacterium sp.]